MGSVKSVPLSQLWSYIRELHYNTGFDPCDHWNDTNDEWSCQALSTRTLDTTHHSFFISSPFSWALLIAVDVGCLKLNCTSSGNSSEYSGLIHNPILRTMLDTNGDLVNFNSITSWSRGWHAFYEPGARYLSSWIGALILTTTITMMKFAVFCLSFAAVSAFAPQGNVRVNTQLQESLADKVRDWSIALSFPFAHPQGAFRFSVWIYLLPIRTSTRTELEPRRM